MQLRTRDLSNFLMDVEVIFQSRSLSSDHQQHIDGVLERCQDVLNELKEELKKYVDLDVKARSKRDAVCQAWKQIRWGQKYIDSLRGRLRNSVDDIHGILSLMNR